MLKKEGDLRRFPWVPYNPNQGLRSCLQDLTTFWPHRWVHKSPREPCNKIHREVWDNILSGSIQCMSMIYNAQCSSTMEFGAPELSIMLVWHEQQRSCPVGKHELSCRNFMSTDAIDMLIYRYLNWLIRWNGTYHSTCCIECLVYDSYPSEIISPYSCSIKKIKKAALSSWWFVLLEDASQICCRNGILSTFSSPASSSR